MELCNVFLSHPVFFVDIAIFICTPQINEDSEEERKNEELRCIFIRVFDCYFLLNACS